MKFTLRSCVRIHEDPILVVIIKIYKYPTSVWGTLVSRESNYGIILELKTITVSYEFSFRKGPICDRVPQEKFEKVLTRTSFCKYDG